MKITKPGGGTPTERLLSTLCEKTFLKLWSWPNPRKDDGKELCDLLALFDDHVFIFFDRESKALQNREKDVAITWRRWKNDAIDKQLNTAKGAARYIRDRHPIFLDTGREQPFPGVMPATPIIHKIIVAHGAAALCQSQATNISGSLAVIYSSGSGAEQPCCIRLRNDDPIHVFDSNNLEIMLSEIDTFRDFAGFIEEKERAIRRHNWFGYCGEEDLLAHYLMNYDKHRKCYRIDTDMIKEGRWADFVKSGLQRRRQEANQQSYFWDKLIQRTYQNTLDGVATGDSTWDRSNPVNEMAREPRLSRRVLAAHMLKAIREFPRIYGHRVTYMPSIDAGKAYVFLQVRFPEEGTPVAVQSRQRMLEIACGVARNRFSDLKIVIGIAMDAPRHANCDGEDFILLNCEHWTDKQHEFFDRENKKFGFFKHVNRIERHIADFPMN